MSGNARPNILDDVDFLGPAFLFFVLFPVFLLSFFFCFFVSTLVYGSFSHKILLKAGKEFQENP
jgi:hypothetical protein